MFSYVCTACGKKTPADTLAPVCGCGGLFELDFKSPKWDDAKIDQKCWSIFRYRDFMAVDGDAWQSVSLGEGMTPLVELEPGLSSRSTTPCRRSPLRIAARLRWLHI